MSFLLDTDHLSILQRESGREFAALSARIAEHSPNDLAVSVVSFHEQALGCHTYITRSKATADVIRGYGMLARVIRDFSEIPVLPFDGAAAVAYQELVSRRVRVGTMDLRIAAIAVSRDLILLTRNTGDFGKIPGLRIEDWTA